MSVADRIWRVVPRPLKRPMRLAADAAKRWNADGAPQLGAAIAFYTMFALAPLLIIAIALAGAVFGAEAARGQIVGQIQGLVGETAAQGIEAMVASAAREDRSGWAGLAGLGTLLVGASGVFAQMRTALNRIGHVQPPSAAIGALVRARLMAFALVLGFGFLAIASLLVSALLAALGAWLSGLLPGAAALIAMLDVAVSTTVIALAFAVLLRWLPDAPPSRRAVITGAVASALLFAVGKHLIGLYLGRESVTSTYGAAGSFVVVMLWVYYSSQILLFGAALAAAIDERRPGDRNARDAAPGAELRPADRPAAAP